MYRLRAAALYHVNVRLKKGLQLNCVITPPFETEADGNRVTYPTDGESIIGIIPADQWSTVSHYFTDNEKPIVLNQVPEHYRELKLEEISGFEILR